VASWTLQNRRCVLEDLVWRVQTARSRLRVHKRKCWWIWHHRYIQDTVECVTALKLDENTRAFHGTLSRKAWRPRAQIHHPAVDRGIAERQTRHGNKRKSL
jgi:hypothetical protein